MLQHLSKISVLLLCALSLSAWAEKADRDKPMHLEADQVVIDDAKQVSTFTGRVQLMQGTLLMRGEKIVVTQDAAGYKHATITGGPASFRQKREGVDEYIDSDAQRIEYDTHADSVDMYGQAHLKRELDDVRGDHIVYSTQTEVFRVESGATPTAANVPKKRVRAVLQPKKDKDKKPAALPIQPTHDLTPAE